MSNIDKQALREAAEKALPAMMRLLMLPNDELFDEALLNVDGDVDAANAFKLLAGPEAVLALLDELEAKDKRLNEILTPNMLLPVVDDMDADNLRHVIKTTSENYSLLHAKWEAAEKRIAELEVRAFNPALLDVISERQRQRAIEGWTSEHDDAYQNSELADAAACYAINAHNQGFSTPAHWPWAPDWWKQSGPRRDLVKAGALILAEIERIDRAAAGKGE